MPRMTDKMLDSGDAFPNIEIAKVGGGTRRGLSYRTLACLTVRLRKRMRRGSR